MIGLIQNECMKLMNRIGTWIMAAIIVIGVVIVFTFVYNTQQEGEVSEEEWRTNLQTEIDLDTEFMEEYGSDSFTEEITRENQYRLDNNLPPPELLPESVWSFVHMSTELLQLVGVFVIVVSATIISNEFKQGTIKLLLIRPPSRTEILISKYITILIFSLFLIAVFFITSFTLGAVFFGFEENYSILIYSGGQIVEQSPIINLFLRYLSSAVNFMMLGTLAFAISSIFRNDTISIAISLLAYMIGSTATNILLAFYEWPRFILFANTNLSQYFSFNGPVVEGMTLGFSITVLVVYWLIFILSAAFIFNKREVKTG